MIQMPPMPYLEEALEAKEVFLLVQKEKNQVVDRQATPTVKVEMPQLPYAPNALEPVISEQTLLLHYGKHLQGYVNNLNALVKGTPFEGKSVEEMVKTAPEGAVFNNAGQTLNHALYFAQFKAPAAGNVPAGKMAAAIDAAFGSFEAFQKQFARAATGLFGSGWAWLSQDKDGKLVITQHQNAGNPLRDGLNPLFGLDVWEHAYYLDYQNRRADHIKAVWDIVDWAVVEKRLR